MVIAFIIKHLIDPINPSETLHVHNQIQICSDASEKNLTSWTNIYKPRPWRTWRKHSNSQFQMANHGDWGIMGYNDQRNSVCHGDKSDECVLFHRTGSISSDKSRSIGLLIMKATNL